MLKATDHGPITRIRMARTVLGRPLYQVSAYLIDGLLVDTGPPATARELAVWCRSRRVERAVNTHHHEDHVGGNRRLRELGVPLAAPAGSLAILARWPRLPLYRRLVWGQPGDCPVEPLGEAVETQRFRFRVVATPGHAADHVCLFEAERRWLLSGDLFVHRRIRYLRRDEDAGLLLASLRRALALGPELMACSHAGLVPDAAAALAGKIRFWEALAQEAAELRRRGHTVARITRKLLGREGALTALSSGDFSKRNLIRSLLAAGEAKGQGR